MNSINFLNFFSRITLKLLENLINNLSLRTLKPTDLERSQLIFYVFLFLSLSNSDKNVLYSQNLVPDKPHIKSVILQPRATNNYVPFIALGETMLLSFDDLNGNEEYYSYEVVHCDMDWMPSNILSSEFIRGNTRDRIRTFDNSFNTLQGYTNYKLEIPNRNMQLKISGNYIITVINESREIVFQRKFVVYEPKVQVGVAIFRSRDLKDIQTKQTVQFNINHPNFRINNPKAEIFPVVMQNNNWQTAIYGLKPQFYRGNQLLYKYNKETTFSAGNEFLYFDSKAVRSTSLNIGRVYLGDQLYHSQLYTHLGRNDRPYTLFEDINGNFVIRTIDGEGSDVFTEADYSWVHFSLDPNTYHDISDKEIYVQGAYNNWKLDDENRMLYNRESGLYETKILMKQGFYNYQYVTKDSDGLVRNDEIDGSFWQTENDYTVIVYYKRIGGRYTEVIGLGKGNSNKINN